MTRFSHIDRRSLMTAYVLAAVAVLSILTLIGQAFVGVFLVLAASIMAALLYRSLSVATVAMPAASTSTQPRMWQHDPNEPVLLTSVVAPDGDVHTARVVPLEHNVGHQLLLTSTGYLVTNADGRVIHSFGPQI